MLEGIGRRLANRPVAQIPQCTSPMSHNAPFYNRNVHMCGHFCYKMVYCGIFVRCVVGFVKWVYCLSIMARCLFRILLLYHLLSVALWLHIASGILVNIGSDKLTCSLFAKPSPKPILTYCELDSKQQSSLKFQSKYKHFSDEKCIEKLCLSNGSHPIVMKYTIVWFYFTIVHNA